MKIRIIATNKKGETIDDIEYTNKPEILELELAHYLAVRFPNVRNNNVE